MFTPKAHIVIVDGQEGAGKKTVSFELAVTLLYNAQKTALVLPNNSSLHQTITNRLKLLPQLLTPTILSKENFYTQANNFNAIIIPHSVADEEFDIMASTYISLWPKNSKNTANISDDKLLLNRMFELKKKIASAYNRSLNWIICENNLTKVLSDAPTEKLKKSERIYGFRAAPPLNYRHSYQANKTGISAQDKSLPMFKKDMTYEDICTKQEIVKLAEFIFST